MAAPTAPRRLVPPSRAIALTPAGVYDAWDTCPKCGKDPRVEQPSLAGACPHCGGDLVSMGEEEVMNLKNLGRTSLLEIKQKLAELPAGTRVLGFNYDTGERYLSVPDFLPE